MMVGNKRKRKFFVSGHQVGETVFAFVCLRVVDDCITFGRFGR